MDSSGTSLNVTTVRLIDHATDDPLSTEWSVLSILAQAYMML